MKWWVYQKERFPLAAHAPLILSFSGCAISYSALLMKTPPTIVSFVVAFVVCLMMFMQLRIADEFKDAEDDARWRPYRPVPRGLVSLAELRVWFIALALIQVGMAGFLGLWLIGILCIAWLYLALMCVEFFCRDWLKARPWIYLISHMGIMPLVDLFATACHWLPLAHGAPSGYSVPAGLGWFLSASFFNGIVIEFGRKIRRKIDEENGVETYSVLWGKNMASLYWVLSLVMTFFCGWQASLLTSYEGLFLSALGISWVGCGVVALIFSVTNVSGKWIEAASALWTLILYITLGILPLCLTYLKN